MGCLRRILLVWTIFKVIGFFFNPDWSKNKVVGYSYSGAHLTRRRKKGSGGGGGEGKGLIGTAHR